MSYHSSSSSKFNKTDAATSVPQAGVSSSFLPLPTINFMSADSTTSFLCLLKTRPDQMGALLLLPMLGDYLHHHIELMHSSSHSKRLVKTAQNTPVGAGGSTLTSWTVPMLPGSSSTSMESLPLCTSIGSYDCSLDSLSSSVLQLLQEGRIYANAVEIHALSALRCLNILIQLCPFVTSVIMKTSSQSSSSSSISMRAGISSAGMGAGSKLISEEVSIFWFLWL